jgi:hypothetical protein
MDNIYIVMEYASKGDFSKVILSRFRSLRRGDSKKSPFLKWSCGIFLVLWQELSNICTKKASYIGI